VDRDALREDAQHLLDLLEMLPPYSYEPFWSELSKHAWGDRRYLDEKMFTVPRNLRRMLNGQDEFSARELAHFAQYVLVFFDGADDEAHRVLDGAVGYTHPSGLAGRRWAEDACATAWRLYVPGRAAVRRSENQELGGNLPNWMR
jgi:hypothetical protein